MIPIGTIPSSRPSQGAAAPGSRSYKLCSSKSNCSSFCIWALSLERARKCGLGFKTTQPSISKYIFHVIFLLIDAFCIVNTYFSDLWRPLECYLDKLEIFFSEFHKPLIIALRPIPLTASRGITTALERPLSKLIMVCVRHLWAPVLG